MGSIWTHADINPNAADLCQLLQAVCHLLCFMCHPLPPSGVPLDVYHQSIHAYLCAATPLEPLLWGLATAYARLNEQGARAAAAGAEAQGGGGMVGSFCAEWTAPEKVRGPCSSFQGPPWPIAVPTYSGIQWQFQGPSQWHTVAIPRA